MASSTSTQSAMWLCCPLSILQKICAPSQSARPDPKAAAAGSTASDSRTIACQLTDVETVVDLLVNTEAEASPYTRSRLTAHLSTRSPSDSEPVEPLGSVIASARQFKGDVTSSDLLTDPTRMQSTFSGHEYVGPLGDMAAAAGRRHLPRRVEGVVTSGDLLTTPRSTVDPLA
jgi:hypothetical protein